MAISKHFKWGNQNKGRNCVMYVRGGGMNLGDRIMYIDLLIIIINYMLLLK